MTPAASCSATLTICDSIHFSVETLWGEGKEFVFFNSHIVLFASHSGSLECDAQSKERRETILSLTEKNSGTYDVVG